MKTKTWFRAGVYLLYGALMFAVLLTACTELQPPSSDIPDFSAITNVKKKKKEFFDFLRPIIKIENAKVRGQRDHLRMVYAQYKADGDLPKEEMEWLKEVCSRYGISRMNVNDPVMWRTLLKRVDIIPVKLALIQAAKESSWGTSRFARYGNNMFGEWCFEEGCGIVPSMRSAGATHEVRKFDSVRQSVRSYLHNLNTHRAYRKFRELRFEKRMSGSQPDAYSLASTLHKYSERREEYTAEIQQMIKTNSALL